MRWSENEWIIFLANNAERIMIVSVTTILHDNAYLPQVDRKIVSVAIDSSPRHW